MSAYRSGLYERKKWILMNTSLKQSILCMETGKKHFFEKSAILEDLQAFKGI